MLQNAAWSWSWGEHLGEPECPYARRWGFATKWGYSLRLHHFIRGDDPRALHDHPWWFVTLILKGGYIDVTEDERGARWPQFLRPGSIHYRPADRPHCVIPHLRGSWSLVLTGRAVRKWGFWVDGEFVGVRAYFRSFGHPPCE